MKIDVNNTTLAEYMILKYVQDLNLTIIFYIYVANTQIIDKAIMTTKCIEGSINMAL